MTLSYQQRNSDNIFFCKINLIYYNEWYSVSPINSRLWTMLPIPEWTWQMRCVRITISTSLVPLLSYWPRRVRYLDFDGSIFEWTVLEGYWELAAHIQTPDMSNACCQTLYADSAAYWRWNIQLRRKSVKVIFDSHGNRTDRVWGVHLQWMRI